MASREPFWASVTKDGQTYRVYFFNDRNGIYALGYPVVSSLGHFVNVGELVFLVGILYATLLLVATLATAAIATAPTSGRAALREVLEFLPEGPGVRRVGSDSDLVLARSPHSATSRVSIGRASACGDDDRHRGAAPGRGLRPALQQRGGAEVLDFLDDQVMVLVRRAIDQDVNLFEPARHCATSERPTVCRVGLLPARTPGTIVPGGSSLDGCRPRWRSRTSAAFRYLLAAAPVRQALADFEGDRDRAAAAAQSVRLNSRADELNRRDSVGLGVVRAARLSASATGWRNGSADPVNLLESGDTTYRPRRSRRPHCRDRRRMNCGGWLRTSTRWPTT